MKTTLHILTLIFISTLVSCGQPRDEKNIPVDTADTLQTSIDKNDKERLDRRKEIEEQDYADSIRLDKVLQDALEIANKNINKDKFIKKYEVMPDSIPLRVEINLDCHFTKTNHHLVIRRNEPSAIYIDIYTKGESKFEKVVSHKHSTLTYVNDAMRDINGDGQNDFVVNWYGSSGCCLKAFSNVYLLRQDKKSFSEYFEFINPTFSPKEKIIRGVCYGHPGETEMYKYKWNGENVDTLEYVSFQKNNKGVKTGKVVLSTDQPYRDNGKILKILDSIPLEYRKIEGYDWFTGKL